MPSLRLILFGMAASVALAACARPANRAFIAGSMREGFHSPGSVRSDSLVVVSYNIQFARRVDDAIEELRTSPRLANADILLLQEMDADGTEKVARALGYDFAYYPASLHPKHDRPFGNAVLSRAAILDHGYVELPVQSPFPVTPRIAVIARIDAGPEPVVVTSLHASTVVVDRTVRLAQFAAVRDSLAGFAGPVIIGGDFNTSTYDDLRLVRAQMREGGYVHARPSEPTAKIPGWQAALGAEPLLDHFFFRGLKILDHGVVSGTQASDHYPIWAVFAWEGTGGTSR